MRQYLDLVRATYDGGLLKRNRTGVDTISYFGYHYRHDMRDGFPLLTTKKISWKNIVVENLWFLSGDPHIEFLRKHGCKFWDPWADDRGLVPSAYGNFWRRFQTANGLNDQYAWALGELRRNPMSRRLVISSWDSDNAQTSKLPPCHVIHVYNTQIIDEEPHLCLHLTQRSCDIALGVPYNLAGYAFLLQLMAHMTGMKVGFFSHTLVDAHIYIGRDAKEDPYDSAPADWRVEQYDPAAPSENHWPGLSQQLAREARTLPTLEIDSSIRSLDDIARVTKECSTDELLNLLKIHGYNPHGAIKFKVAV